MQVLQALKKSTHVVTLLALTAALSGCSLFSDDDEEIKIAPLQPINQSVTPQVKWRTDVGDGVGDYFSRLNPVVAYDKVYAADRQGVVMALDKNSGDAVWEVDLHQLININEASDQNWFSGIFSSPFPARISGGLVASYNKVYLGTENGDLVALDAETGELVWHTEVGNEVNANPAVGEGRVVVHTTGGKVISYDAEDGEEQWQYEYQTPTLTLRGSSAPTIASGGVIVGDSNGTASILIANNGQQAWTQAVGSPSGATELEALADIDANPVVVGTTVYMIAYNGELAALELRSGEVRWKRDYSAFENLLVRGNRIYLTDHRSHLYALNQDGGIELWSNNQLFGRQLTGPAWHDGYVVSGDFEGYLHWFEAADGSIAGRLDVGGNGLYAQPVIDGETLYTQTRDGDLIAIQLTAGN
ncbi:outer membrane protein assembly factor BamB [Idiomarina seosinensis]|uniref:outer membrane protein assembly factor BamB n=1 Tax=Idiomarina seosinensis TaxID=281739 RepID=UPI00384B5DD8